MASSSSILPTSPVASSSTTPRESLDNLRGESAENQPLFLGLPRPTRNPDITLADVGLDYETFQKLHTGPRVIETPYSDITAQDEFDQTFRNRMRDVYAYDVPIAFLVLVGITSVVFHASILSCIVVMWMVVTAVVARVGMARLGEYDEALLLDMKWYKMWGMAVFVIIGGAMCFTKQLIIREIGLGLGLGGVVVCVANVWALKIARDTKEERLEIWPPLSDITFEQCFRYYHYMNGIPYGEKWNDYYVPDQV